MHPDLIVAAARHGGAFTRQEALACGYSPAAIRYRLRTGRWLAPHPGVYVDRAAWEADRLRVTAAAACRSLPGTVASHTTAALLRGIAVLGKDELCLTRERAGGHYDLAGSHRLYVAALPDEHICRRDGLPMTVDARTVVDLARRSFDGGVVAADCALHLGRVTVAELEAVLERCRGWPGVQRARDVAAFADARAESPLESISRVRMRRNDVPPPELQVEIGPFRVDFLWEDRRTVGEADGMVKYDGADPDVLRAEKLRQEYLDDQGFEVVRWRWAHTRDGGTAMAARIMHGFRRSAQRHRSLSA